MSDGSPVSTILELEDIARQGRVVEDGAELRLALH